MKRLMIFMLLGLLTGSALAQLEERTHRVSRGETLWGISDLHWKDPFYWPFIYDANREKIRDPHWIYPGQEFRIPPLPPSPGLAELPPVPEVPPEVVVPEVPEVPVVEAPEVPPEAVEIPEIPEEVVAIPEEIPPAKEGKAISFVERPTPVVPSKLLFQGGYIVVDEEIEGGVIMDSEPPDIKHLTTYHSVYLNWGEEDGVEVGDEFTIFRIGNRVIHPETGEDLGVILRILGRLEVKEVLPQSSKAEITESYEVIYPEDRFMPSEEVKIPEDILPLPTQEVLDAILVAFRDPGDIRKPFEICYIDKGEESGVKFGDVFEIYRSERTMADPETGRILEISDLVVGELQVLRPKGSTSSAYLTSINGSLDIKTGETLRLVKRIPG